MPNSPEFPALSQPDLSQNTGHEPGEQPRPRPAQPRPRPRRGAGRDGKAGEHPRSEPAIPAQGGAAAGDGNGYEPRPNHRPAGGAF
ncbi:MAG TPA: hypothetical protein VFM49_01015, partial [Chloroflexia bacterium]|nr:hypothetical protein [Chloroflexia bacterium]